VLLFCATFLVNKDVYIKSRSSLLAPAHPVGPGKRAVKRLWLFGANIAFCALASGTASGL